MTSISTLRGIALGASLGFVLAVVPSCGGLKPATTDGGGKCSSTSCAGCCDGSGNCQTGASPNVCGVDGAACQVCSSGMSCSTGVCKSGSGGNGGTGGSGGTGTGGSGGTGGSSGGGVGGSGGTGGNSGGGMGGSGGGSASCNNSNCTGCCDQVNGMCRNGNADNLCGGGGLACKVCNVGLGESCQNSQCIGGACGPLSCATGCCSGMTCVTPQTAFQCGTAGATCVTCQGANPQCDVDAGVCLGGTGGAGGGNPFPGLDGGFAFPCPSPCQTGQCCDFGLLCVNSGSSCIFTGILTPGATCNATSGVCQ